MVIQQKDFHGTLRAAGPPHFDGGVETGVPRSAVLARPSTRNPMPVRRSGFCGPNRLRATAGEYDVDCDGNEQSRFEGRSAARFVVHKGTLGSRFQSVERIIVETTITRFDPENGILSECGYYNNHQDQPCMPAPKYRGPCPRLAV